MFSKKNKSVSAKVEASTPPTHFEKALDWEASRIQQIEKSERRAWSVVLLEAGVIGALAVAIALMLPLKETQPYVLKVDKSTGTTEIMTVANVKDVNYEDTQDKYWLNQYIRSRETYDWRTVENDFIKTREMSDANVFLPYSKLFEGNDSLEKKIGDKKRVVTEIQSVVPNGNGIATVRFIKKTIDNQSGEESKSLWTATIGYEYHPEFKVKEENRLINPFGFKVTSYRVDAELMDTPTAAGAGAVNTTPATQTPTVDPKSGLTVVNPQGPLSTEQGGAK